MFGSPKSHSTVGLEIETGSIAATEVRNGGSSTVQRTAVGPLPAGIVSEGEVHDLPALSACLKTFFADHKLGKTVRLGVANQRVVVRTMRLPLIENDDERDTAVRFQAQDQIPMPLDQAVLDHQVISSDTTEGGDRSMDVVAVAARRDMVMALLGALRSAGLRPVGIDLSAFGMIRALSHDEGAAPDGALQRTSLYCHLGDITNLAVARGGQCMFTRIAPFGIESIAARVSERHAMPLDDARAWLIEVGLDEPLEDFVEDREEAAGARAELEDGTSKLAGEIRTSMEFYGAQAGVPPVDNVVVCGPGSTIPGLAARLQADLGLDIESRTPDALAAVDDEDAARLTVSYGLALNN
jgi:type IV pilus assembly protein PilM